MGDLLVALRDNQHLVLLGAAVWGYFKWRDVQRQLVAGIEADRKAHREMVEEIIKASLSNGIGHRIREILNEIMKAHESVERAALDQAIGSFRAENTDAHKMIGQRQSELEQRAAILESKWASVLGPTPRKGKT